ncbi:MAG: dTDP-4-dehydrorhamnose reductase [Pseudomonadales bacterium]|jgi:dTDP-4-dehydrorhamnose reductase|nr:dTDP-4-dehydrorhamnose reductase [Pseudomonadales bacterium]
MSKPLILLTGCLGQLGSTIQLHWSASQLAASHELLAVDIDQLDLTDAEDVTAYLNQLKPAVIINAAAYTNVDGAETDEELAYAVNAEAVSCLVSWCAANPCRLIQVSTDFVFDGAQREPYKPDAAPAPLSVYGASKLAGENEILERLPQAGIIVRTSWLYSEFGGNFVKTMLRIMADKRELKVVNDQIGSPTSAHTLTQFLFELIQSETSSGMYHWTDGGEISWFDFAEAIYVQGKLAGLLANDVTILPIPSAEYPTPATRPYYSVLDRSSSLALTGSEPQGWQSALQYVISSLAQSARTSG